MYPTREQILAGEVKHKPEVIRFVKTWKLETWKLAKLGGTQDRQEAMAKLVREIALVTYRRPVNGVHFDATGSSYYRPATRTVHLNAEPSIITALHELAHHLFGLSELKACRWSVHLFRKVFPRAYAQLAWDGHVLRRPTAAEVALTSPGPRRLAAMFPIGR